MNNGGGPRARVLVRMNDTGEVTERLVTKELHHINGRGITDPHAASNLQELWPWEHAEIDPGRHLGYEFLGFQ